MVTSGRPLRADAQRNRARVLEAAEQLLWERGAGVRTEEVAKAAGVGVGTVFRHFPTKEALFSAVYTAGLERLTAEAEALAAEAKPGEAFFGFFTKVVGESERKLALADALEDAGIDVAQAHADAGAGLRDVLSRLLAQAQQSGAVRGDIGVLEVMALLVGATRAVKQAGADPGVRARALAVVLDGLRPTSS
ncbi:TetR/AcrR family transcriptional regulator [Streptomyces boninensis]|uniref:TetR/AcrR family transcriptional regulator n=1 Tax=Streptomyces boninensis TaxID=2039455 RepID=UPI003B20DDB0